MFKTTTLENGNFVVNCDGVVREYTAKEVADFTAKQAEREKELFWKLSTCTNEDVRDFNEVATSFVFGDKEFKSFVNVAKDITDKGVYAVQLGQYGEGYQGKGDLISCWCRTRGARTKYGPKRADYGIRFSQKDFARFYSVPSCHAWFECFADRMNANENNDNEFRFSFTTLPELTRFMGTLWNCYQSATIAKVAEPDTATVTA